MKKGKRAGDARWPQQLVTPERQGGATQDIAAGQASPEQSVRMPLTGPLADGIFAVILNCGYSFTSNKKGGEEEKVPLSHA